MVAKAQRKPHLKVPGNSAPVGSLLMVAPTNQAARQAMPNFGSGPQVGTFHKLPGREDATYKVAPSLSSFIRRMLQAKQVPNENINLYLRGCKSIDRYDKAFRTLWAMVVQRGRDPQSLSLQGIASEIAYMASIHLNEARQAYSAFAMVPGYDGLKFSPLLKRCKSSWSTFNPKYSDFWDGSQILKKLAEQPVNWKSVQAVRDRLILCLRLVHLCRSIDLQQSWRTLSFQGDKLFLLLQRKGQKTAQWEPIIKLSCQDISPVKLLLQYVSMTRTSCLPGSPLFRSVVKPFKPLTANSLGRITKLALTNLGIPTNVFGPHSTRGAGVKMYKAMGLDSETVCQLGKWKNAEAFNKHYMRLNSCDRASSLIDSLVHTVSSWRSAEPERSPSPGREPDLGRSDLEGEAQSQD